MTASMPLVGAYRHGGRLSEAAAAFPRAPTPWLDLSTGINPKPWRGARAEWSDLSRLPDPADIADLESAAAGAFGVGDPRRVLATAGAEAALRLLPAVIDATEAAIVSPTYSGHADAWRLARRSIVAVTQDVAQVAPAPVLVIVNPNNPDGWRMERGPLLDLAARRSKLGLWTIVDESFVETAPNLSVANEAIENLVVLRSFGKFYGLPGVRLGFVVTEPGLIADLRAIQGDWPVSTDAVTIGRSAYLDGAWRMQTRERLDRDTQALDDLLTAQGFTIVGGTSLFRLIATPRAGVIFEGLCERGILTRPFEDARDRLRFGVPCQTDLVRLAQALKDLKP
jgi:cobalamin biosynthetic protein CobC